MARITTEHQRSVSFRDRAKNERVTTKQIKKTRLPKGGTTRKKERLTL